MSPLEERNRLAKALGVSMEVDEQHGHVTTRFQVYIGYGVQHTNGDDAERVAAMELRVLKAIAKNMLIRLHRAGMEATLAWPEGAPMSDEDFDKLVLGRL